MRTALARLLVVVCCMLMFTCVAAMAAAGPQTSWNVLTLPNPQITPAWRTYAPSACQPSPEACAGDNRFWEQWDFKNFQSAIDSTFAAERSMGQYQGVMMILPLGDTSTYFNNIRAMYNSASSHGVQLQLVVFPKWKFGGEYCYLYNSNSPAACPAASGTTTAVAFRKLIKLMNFAQTLSGPCTAGSYNRNIAVWYGWGDFSPGYAALKNFWQALGRQGSLSGCNLQAAYITWLDTPYSGTAEVQQLQKYVVNQLKRPYWVNTELYSAAQIQANYSTYAPYQTIITGYWGASDLTSWAKGMCAHWNTAAQPVRLASWTFYDMDLTSSESYRAYINGGMAAMSSICTY
jgi:hypothetical protein